MVCIAFVVGGFPIGLPPHLLCQTKPTIPKRLAYSSSSNSQVFSKSRIVLVTSKPHQLSPLKNSAPSLCSPFPFPTVQKKIHTPTILARVSPASKATTVIPPRSVNEGQNRAQALNLYRRITHAMYTKHVLNHEDITPRLSRLSNFASIITSGW
jgi:hypothetical protein